MGFFMKKFFITYKTSFILILSVFLGGIVGGFIGDNVKFIKPIGDLFLNLLFTTLVPLVFFCTSSALASTKKISRMGSILKNTIIVFIFTTIISFFITILSLYFLEGFLKLDLNTFKNIVQHSTDYKFISLKSLLENLANIVTVSDFSLLLSKNNILPLIIFSAMFGFSTSLCGDNGKAIEKFLISGKDIMLKFIDIIMKFAPIGLACYFANIVHEVGMEIFSGYFKIFILYLFLTLFSYFVLCTFYMYLVGGKNAIKIFWKNIIPPSIVALASCSSSAALSANLIATKKMGIPEDISETVLPLGLNIHKDGSFIGNILKIFFLYQVMNQDMFSLTTIFIVFIVAFITSVIIGAIPSGGVTGEVTLITMLGFSPELLPFILVISTIIDAPATLLNSTGNTACVVMITKLTDKN